MKSLIAGTAVCLLISAVADADVRLGFLPDEPAPSVAAALSSLEVAGETIQPVPFQSVELLLKDLREARIDAALLEEPADPVTGVSLVTELYPSVLHVLYSPDAGMEDPAVFDELLLSGSIYTGVPGSAGAILVDALIADYLLDADAVQVIESALAEDPDVYFIFGGLLSADALRRLQGFRIFSLGDPNNLMQGTVAEALSLRYRNLHPFILPAGLYPSLGREAALTVAVSTLLVVRTDQDEQQVFALAALIDRARPLLSDIYPLAALPALIPEHQQVRTLPLANGAQRYLDRDEPGLLERYAEVITLGLSLVIALGSASVAFERRRRQTRKDRLDGYFSAVLAARPGARTTEEELQIASALIRGMQSEVLELVAAERIDADDALIAFLTLSNQILAETERV